VKARKTKAFTLIELLVVVAIIALLISILLPSLARAREIAKRAVCSANLKGVGTGLKVYANDNYDWYPIAPFEAMATSDENETAVSFVGNMGLDFTTTMEDPVSDVHPSRSLFMLVVDGTCTAKQFICPSAGDAEDDLRNKYGSTVVAAQPGVNRFDFKGYPYVSYGYQLPFGRGKPNENLDPRMAVSSDKGPYFTVGASSGDTGRVADQAVTSAAIELGTDATEILRLNNDRWRPYNSSNHATEGQNVLFQDGHVEFTKKPIVGVNYDNIFTMHDGDELHNTLAGQIPEDELGPWRNTDSVIVP
jgi:prepilin-type N-terminal cleavage/methylation domain-containing protein/prepilin-type processing-associated H-X9-DG protein